MVGGEREMQSGYFLSDMFAVTCDYNRLSSGCYGEHSPTDMTPEYANEKNRDWVQSRCEHMRRIQ